jgi:hypothetical protein
VKRIAAEPVGHFENLIDIFGFLKLRNHVRFVESEGKAARSYDDELSRRRYGQCRKLFRRRTTERITSKNPVARLIR